MRVGFDWATYNDVVEYSREEGYVVGYVREDGVTYAVIKRENRLFSLDIDDLEVL